MSTPENKSIPLPEVEINLVKVKSPVEATIKESWIATDGSSPNYIRHITFDVSGTELEGKFVAGQSIGVLAPGEDEHGKAHKLRLYSVSSPTGGEGGQPHLVSTTVKRVIDEHWETQQLFTGVCSNYLCSLKPGDKVMVTGPSGKSFVLPENPEKYHYVFFATGTGVAPFRAMVLDLLKQKVKSKIALVFGCPYRTDLLYYKDFVRLDKVHDNFHYITAISREGSRADGTKPYVQTTIDDHQNVLHPILSQSNTLIYICGLKGMETGIYTSLLRHGFKDYCKLNPELEAKDPGSWTREEIHSGIKASYRTFEEVY
jgi:ferredoxin--NADP+ reductase